MDGWFEQLFEIGLLYRLYDGDYLSILHDDVDGIEGLVVLRVQDLHDGNEVGVLQFSKDTNLS